MPTEWLDDIGEFFGDGLNWLFGGGGSGSAAGRGIFDGGLFGVAGDILGSDFWGSPMAGHIIGAVGMELLRDDPYDVALARETARRDAMDFGFTPVDPARQTIMTGGYNRQGGARPVSADWWQEETEAEREERLRRERTYAN